MDFSWISDPTALAGLGALIALELVLGIDNLVFIAILAERLPPEQRNRARMIGLGLALFMRLGLLFSISWVVGLTEPLFSLGGFGFSGRDLILLVGGLFLLFKATTELHERLEGAHGEAREQRDHAAFWQVVAQIVVLDAVFSLDSVITAVGMVSQLEIMVVAVVIAMMVMLAAARPLMEFVSRHPTVVILCLAFLLMIGFSLIAEAFSFHIPKGYLYAAIGFSVLIEAFNQAAQRNRRRLDSSGDVRDRTAAAVLRLLGGGRPMPSAQPPTTPGAAPETTQGGEAVPAFGAFAPEERSMVQGVMSLGERNVRSIMTSRTEVVWLDLDAPAEASRQRVLESGHSRFPVARGRLDQVVGIALARDLLPGLLAGGGIDPGKVPPPLVIPDGMGVLPAMTRLRQARVQIAVVVDEYGAVVGVVTPTDILEAIAGDFREGNEAVPAPVQQPDGSWLVDAQTDLYRLGQVLGTDLAEAAGGRYATLGGHLMWRLGRLPKPGERLREGDLDFVVESLAGIRPGLVRVRAVASADNAAAPEASAAGQ